MIDRQYLQDHIAMDGNGCWLWTSGLDKDGYGKCYQVYGNTLHTMQAHRASYTLYVGPIPDGLHVDHTCRVRRCINPDHLEAVTPRENALRSDNMAARNHRKTHCKRGHQFAEENTITYINRNGFPTRKCRICEEAKARKATRKRMKH